MSGIWIAAAAAASLGQAELAPPVPAGDTAAPAAGAADSGVIAYPASFFAEARPTNAFDMIQRLPGFTFRAGEEVRGFAGAAGNVLIDNERPTSKAVSLEELLRRIPAAQVVRIDLVRGGAPGIDMQGQVLVANVIRSRSAAQSIAVIAGSRYYSDGTLGPQADLEWSRRAGDLSLEGAIRYGWDLAPDGGGGQRIRYFPSGALRESGDYFARERRGTFTANATAQLNRVANVYRLNVGVSRTDNREYERLDRNPVTGPPRGLQITTEPRVEDTLEIGGDYTRIFSDRLKGEIIALQTLSRQDSIETSSQPGALEAAAGREKAGESILRTMLTAQPSDALTIEGGGEGAFNFLDSRTAITFNGVAVPIPNDTVRVEEKRAEAFLNLIWKASDALSVDARVRLEVSQISQSGDTDLSRSFFFPKPRLLVTYSPDPVSQVRLRLEREVGQLDFGDFAANTDFGTGVISAGGAQLQPERAWVAEVALERRFWDRGAVVLTLTHEEAQEVVDRISVGGLDAPGNIGDGTRDRVNLAVTLPLDRLGIANGLITGQATRRRSKVTDPVTGESRRISGELPLEGNVAFSQDVNALSSTWGIELRISEWSTEYRVNEIRRESEDSMWSVYWDYKPDPTLSVRAEFRNLNGRERRRWRQRFPGGRNVVGASDIEWQDNRFDPFLYFRVRKVL